MDKLKKLKVLLGIVKETFQTAILSDGKEISFEALEINREVFDSNGEPLKEGEYLITDGTRITVDVNGVIKEIEKADGETEREEVVAEMAEEVTTETKTTETETTETTEPKKEDSARIDELEKKVDELYNAILSLLEKERERGEKVEEIRAEFAAVSATPSAAPVFVGASETAAPKTKIDKIKALKKMGF